MTRGAIEKDITDMGKQVDESGIWNQVKKMTEQKRQQKLVAEKDAYPGVDTEKPGAIEAWNVSDVRKEKQKFCTATWEKARARVKPARAHFNSFGQFGRIELHHLNRDRQAGYNFTNMMYASKRPKYLPVASNPEKGDKAFHPIDTGATVNAPPVDDPEQEPTCWVLEVMGDTPGIKKQEATPIVFTKYMKELLDKYRDVKEVMFEVSVNTLCSGALTQKSFRAG